ncbi:MAG: hypothetical protein EBU31_09145 [Proteobacteria bacterium]|jgi:hypothetical protein|nr:hypothetical protein [Pseudomonadota bacterium]
METGHPAPNRPPPGSAMAAIPPAHPQAEPSFVVVPRWRWRVYLHPASWALSVMVMLGSVITFMLAVALSIFASEIVDRWAAGAWGAVHFVVGVAVLVAVVAACVLTLRALFRWSARRSATSFEPTIPISEPARGFMLAELRESGPPKDSWSTWHARRWVDEVRQHSPARIYLSRRLEERAVRYDRTDRPVEPERVGTASGRSGIASVLFFVGMATYFALRGGLRSPTPWVFGFFAAGTLVRLIRRRAVFAPVIAGQGWIEHGSARWTVNDSVIVATGWSNAHVRVVGPAGVLSLQLQTGRGKDFEALWMRWMHPVPNLEQRAFDA